MRSKAPIRILIADDHEAIRYALKSLLTIQPDLLVVAEAANGQEAIDLFRLQQPDITLMDVRMPVLDGLTASRTILAEFPQARILLFTVSEEEEEPARRIGIQAVVLKIAPFEELLAAIHTVYSAG